MLQQLKMNKNDLLRTHNELCKSSTSVIIIDQNKVTYL